MVASTALALLALAAEPRLAVDLRLSPELALRLERQSGAVDLASPSAADARPGGIRAGAVVRASLGIALGDVISLALMLPAFADSCFLESCSPPAWVGPLFIAGLGSYLFLPPAVGVWFARSGSPGERTTRAYWLSFLVRIGALAAASAGPVGPFLYLGAELLAAPYVIARVLATPPAAASGQPLAASHATPERDPAAPRGR